MKLLHFYRNPALSATKEHALAAFAAKEESGASGFENFSQWAGGAEA